MRVDLTKAGLELPEPSNAGRAGQTASDSGSGTDQASLSFDQARVQSLETQVLAQPEIRQAKVEALRQAIGDGEYAVSPGQVADAMTSELSLGAQG